jgi:hypothetical protein
VELVKVCFSALKYMNVEDWRTGFGCDGCSANMAEGGLKNGFLFFGVWPIALNYP